MALRGGYLTRHPVVLAQNGKLCLAPCGNDVRVYATRSGELVLTLRGHSKKVTAIAENPSSKQQVKYAPDFVRHAPEKL
jgi:hypothetical protein